MTVITFAVLGLGAGAVYAVTALGLVQIYRGSGVLNFAQGAYVLLAAVTFARLSDADLPIVVCAAVAIAVAAAAGVLTQQLVMRPLASAAPLVRMIATLGVLTVIQQAIPLAFGDSVYADYNNVPSFLPSGGVRVGAAVLQYDRLIILGVAVVVTLAVWWIAARTRFGLSTTAVAESPLVSEALRVSPNRTATLNWALGGALAGVAGVAIAPISGVAPSSLILLVVPALGVALAGGFANYPVTLAVGIAVGVGQSVLSRYQTDIFPDGLRTGWPEALPFLVIIAALVIRGNVFPRRGELASRLPSVGRARLHPALLPVLVFATSLVIGLFVNGRLADAILTSSGLALVGLSLVVLTGLAGQISLGQLAIGGVGALCAARLGLVWQAPFPVLVLAGMLGGALVGLVFALPALRARGPILGVITLGLGLAVQYTVFNSRTITAGGMSGTAIDAPTLLGLSIDASRHPNRAAAVQCAVLLIVCWMVCSMRAGPLGRRFLALRGNERAAASLGIPVARTKLLAFVIASAIAGLGGVFIGYRSNVLTYEQFGALQSLQLVVYAAIGGFGFVLGPLVGALGSPGGVIQFLFADLPGVARWMLILGGVTMILTLIFSQDGVVGAFAKMRSRTPPSRARWDAPVDTASDPDGGSLIVHDLTVSHGSVTGLRNLSLVVRPGEIVGLIGPNGAGKTTAIDAISGFTPAAGSIMLGDQEISSLPPHERSIRGVGRTFQGLDLFEDLSVEENLACAVERDRRFEWLLGLFRIPHISFSPAVREIVDAFDLGDDLGSLPGQLPQGRRRAVGIARALAANPRIVLLDEPAAGLNSVETRALGDTLRRVAQDAGVGFLLVEHDMALVTDICDRVVALDFGVTIFSGSPNALMSDALVRESYLGQDHPAESDLNLEPVR